MSTRSAPILLVDSEFGAEVQGTLLYDPTYDEIKELDHLWRPYVRLALPELKMRQAPEDAVPDYLAWYWAHKMRLGRMQSWRFFCIGYRGRIQGAIVLSTVPGACMAEPHEGMDALGVEFLAAAPWNIGRFMRSVKREPFLDLVGPTLLRVAIALSQATTDREGRLYLYSVPRAERFYRDNCGMLDLGLENHSGEVLRRFEMTREGAAAFMAGG